MNQQLVLAPHQIHLRENGGPGQLNGQILDVWDQVPDKGGNFVQPAEIPTGMATLVSLGDHVQKQGPRAAGATHDAEPFHRSQLFELSLV